MALPKALFIFIVLVHDVVTQSKSKMGPPPQSQKSPHLHHNQHHGASSIQILISDLNDHNEVLLSLIAILLNIIKIIN